MKRTLVIITTLFCALLFSISVQAQNPPAVNFYNVNGKFKQEGSTYTVTISQETKSMSQGILVTPASGKSVYYVRNVSNQPNKYICDGRPHQSIEILSDNRLKYHDSNKNKTIYFSRVKEQAIATDGTFKHENIMSIVTVKSQQNSNSRTKIIDIMADGKKIDSYIQDANKPNKYNAVNSKGDYIEYINVNQFKLVGTDTKNTSTLYNRVNEAYPPPPVTFYNVNGKFKQEGSTYTVTISQETKSMSQGINVTPASGKSAYYIRNVSNQPNKYICDGRPNQSIEFLSDDRLKYYDSNKNKTIYFSRVKETTQKEPTNDALTLVVPIRSSFKVDNNHDVINRMTTKSNTSARDNKLGFMFSVANDITWWKGIKVFDKNGNMICLLSTQDDQKGPKISKTFDTSQFNGTVKVEFWKAKTFGVHTHVGTEYFKLSELAGSVTEFKWMND